MRHVALLSALAGLVVLPATSQAAEWYDSPAGNRSLAASPAQAADQFLVQQASKLRLSSVNLRAVKQFPHRGFATIRYQQQFKGLPVFNSAVAVRVAPGGVIRAAMLDIHRDLRVSTTPTLDADQARAVVSSAMGKPVGPDSRATLGIMADEARGGVLVYRIEILTAGGMMRYVVDAHAGIMIQRQSLARDILGRVYDIDWQATPTPQDRELLNLTPPVAPDGGVAGPQRLTGRAGTVYRHIAGDLEQDPDSVVLEQVAEPNSGEDFLFDPPASEPTFDDTFSEVNLYYHMDRIDAYFRDTFGVALGHNLMIVGNYSPGQQSYPNAFYTPWQYGEHENAIFLGQSYDGDFSYDSDVILHEFTHYVNNTEIGFSDGPFDFDQYGMVTMPGALEEGSADYFSSTVNNDPVVGAAALGYYARDLEDKSGKCPDDMIGESHEDGKLVGSTSWSLRQLLGQEIGDQVVWASLTMLPARSSLADFAKGITQSVADFETQGLVDAAKVQGVADILAGQGLDQCDRMMSIDPSTPRRTTMFGLEMMGQYIGFSCSQLKNYGVELSSIFQFKYQAQPADTRVRFNVEMQAWGGGVVDWNMHVRKGKPIGFSSGSGYVPKASTFDYSLNGIKTSKGEIVVDASSDPAFDPAGLYYIVITYSHCPFAEARVTVSTTDLPIEPDAGVDAAPDAPAGDAWVPPTDGGLDAGGDASGPVEQALEGQSDSDSGCGCRQASRAPRGAALGGLLALGAAAMMRRRRPGR